MARINIEDSLYTDPRFQAIERKLPRFVAKGAFLEIAKCAQEYWLRGKELIPKNIWNINEFPLIFVEFGLVIEKENGFYLSGSEEQFRWLSAKVENGKKGGRPREINNLTKATDNLQKATGKLQKATANPLTLSLSLSPTLTHNSDINKKVSNNKNISSPIIFDENEINLTNKLVELMKFNNPTAKIPNNLDSWKKEASLLLKKDKKDFQESMQILEWCQRDKFWYKNILSMAKFREKYEQLKLNSFQSEPIKNKAQESWDDGKKLLEKLEKIQREK